MNSFSHYLLIFSLFFILGMTGCNFLDVVPDNVATLENAFENKNEAEKYLATVYSYLPEASTVGNILFFGADDIWSYEFNNDYPGAWKVAKGEQGVSSPHSNFWDGGRDNAFSKDYFKAIRDCNIFLENLKEGDGLRNIVDLDKEDQIRWIGETEFLKAFYNFFLMRMYGPIPIIDENLPISADPDEVKVERATFDENVNYVVNLIDSAVEKLPSDITKLASEYGRATKAAALFLKAKILVTAASPLFNGNPDYTNFVNKDGNHLISVDYDESKWQRAVEACEEAIYVAESAGFRLYEFSDAFATNLSDTTVTQLSIRGSVSAEDDLNTEAIWSLSGVDLKNDHGDDIQDLNIPQNIDLDPSISSVYLGSYFSATLKIAEMFYTENGVPIDEDKDWDYNNRYNLKTAVEQDKFNIQPGYTTAYLNFNRENRFYADLGFDGGAYYLQSAGSDLNTYYLHGKMGETSGKSKNEFYNVTGYWVKNIINWKYTTVRSDEWVTELYAWPLFKLNDLYLLYAEALNEMDEPDKAIEYIDKIRNRAGLKGVKESWSQHSKNPNKYSSKDGLREIIHRERYIELCFQSQRNWDIRRWKEAAELMNQPVRGWDILQKETNLYYRAKTIFNQTFNAPRDYLWPIKENSIIVNPNLIQNPSW